MPRSIIQIENTASRPFGSFTTSVRLGRVAVSLAISDSGWLAELKVNGELFSGKGGSAVLALQDLQTGIMKAAVKHQRRGRAPEKVRVAATLLQGEPN